MGKGVRCLRTYKEAKKHLLDARREADTILAEGANRLLLIEAILIVCVFVAIFSSLQSSVALLLSTTVQNEALIALLYYGTLLICLALGILFAAPIMLGLFRLAEQMQSQKAPVLMDLFYFLSTPQRYRRGLRITRAASFKIALAAILTNGIDLFWGTFPPDAWAWNLLCGILKVVIVILCIFWLLLPYPKLNALLQKEKYVPNRCRGWHFIKFFFLWILLGFASIGLLLVLDVIPRMLLTYFCDCKRQTQTSFDL